MYYSLSNFEKDIKEILSICYKELKSESNHLQATIEQIEGTIIPEMEDLLKKIYSNELPPKEKRWILSAAYITRGWNWNIWSKDPLTTKLPQLDDKYQNELEF